MIARINVGRIILDHFKTLRSLNQSYNFMNIGDIFLFLGLPFIIAIITTLNGYNFQNHLSDLIATISISWFRIAMRVKYRPILPNPLIATRIAIFRYLRMKVAKIKQNTFRFFWRIINKKRGFHFWKPLLIYQLYYYYSIE